VWFSGIAAIKIPACGEPSNLSDNKEQVCVFVATKTPRMPTAPGKLAFCARWLQKE